MNDDFIPRVVVHDSIHYWWVLVFFMILGSAGGAVFHMFRPPVYEARSLITVSVDYSQTGDLSELDQDRALENVGDAIVSTRVMREVVSQANEQGISLDENAFRQIAFRERMSYAYLFRVRHEDANIAAVLANLWTEEAYRVLNRALEHAIAAQQLQSGADALNNCLEAVVSEPVHAYCNLDHLEEIQNMMLETGELIFEEKKDSMGLIAGLSFTWTEEAIPPITPRLYSRNLMVLSGAFIGFIIGVWVIALRLPGRIIPRRKST